MVTIEELKRKIESIGYYPTEELLYDTFNALVLFGEKEKTPGQDIYAICLDGPPGAGKTSFANAYTSLCNEIYGNVELVSYQCDPTTGKGELFEDINIVAVVTRDGKKINIPGYLLKAILAVNEGKKVILFIDEYDKAREETDSFFLQLIQSGRINTTQFGDLEIKKELLNNLQIIFCRNDMREELSGPLTRRLRLISLDYMKPDLFYKVAHRNLIEEAKNPVNEGLLNLVSLIYEQTYESRDIYNRLPAASEMMIAISDANRLMTQANAPQYILYNIILKNMFKSKDDRKTFEARIKKLKNEKDGSLAAVIETMKVVNNDSDVTQSINELIAKNVLKGESGKLVEKQEQMQKLIDEYQGKFAQMEQQKQSEIDKLRLNEVSIVPMKAPQAINMFEDESKYVKRGQDVYSLSSDWIEIAEFKYYHLALQLLIENIIKYSDKLKITVYENGFVITESDMTDVKIIIVCDRDEDNQINYHVLANKQILPSIYLKDIKKFMNFVDQVYDNQPKTTKRIAAEAQDLRKGYIKYDLLVYNDKPLKFNEIESNIYHVEDEYALGSEDFNNMFTDLFCTDVVNAMKECESVISSSKKRLTK